MAPGSPDLYFGGVLTVDFSRGRALASQAGTPPDRHAGHRREELQYEN